MGHFRLKYWPKIPIKYIELNGVKKMVIDKIGNINNITEPKGAKGVSREKGINKSDSIQISSEGKTAAENASYVKMVKDAPDIRADRVNEIKERIREGRYEKFADHQVLEMVADKIAEKLLRK